MKCTVSAYEKPVITQYFQEEVVQDKFIDVHNKINDHRKIYGVQYLLFVYQPSELLTFLMAIA